MTKYEAMFHIPLIRTKVEDWEEKKEKLLKLANTCKFSVSNGDSVLSDFFEKDDYKEDQRKQVQEILEEDIKDCELLIINGGDLKLSNAWFEKSKKGMTHGIHNHGALGFSGLCYIQYDKNEHTPVHFIAPFNSIKQGLTLTFKPDDISEGTMLIFPSFVHHFTLPNTSAKERICVAFNFEKTWNPK